MMQPAVKTNKMKEPKIKVPPHHSHPHYCFINQHIINVHRQKRKCINSNTMATQNKDKTSRKAMVGKNLLFLFFSLISLSWTPSRIKYKTCHKGRGATCEQTAIHIWCQLHQGTSSCSWLPFQGGWWQYLYSGHHKTKKSVCCGGAEVSLTRRVSSRLI